MMLHTARWCSSSRADGRSHPTPRPLCVYIRSLLVLCCWTPPHHLTSPQAPLASTLGTHTAPPWPSTRRLCRQLRPRPAHSRLQQRYLLFLPLLRRRMPTWVPSPAACASWASERGNGQHNPRLATYPWRCARSATELTALARLCALRVVCLACLAASPSGLLCTSRASGCWMPWPPASMTSGLSCSLNVRLLTARTTSESDPLSCPALTRTDAPACLRCSGAVDAQVHELTQLSEQCQQQLPPHTRTSPGVHIYPSR